MGSVPTGYRARRPQDEALYRVLAEHLETFLARHPELPFFVVRELRAFLDCGILARGFARLHCASCGEDTLIAFSCKRRGFCPSCGARRMTDLAMHLVECVLPDVPVRQWVISLPFSIRYVLAYDAELCREVRSAFVGAVQSWICRRARDHGDEGGQTGAVTFTQRFDSAIRLNVHFHALFLDGVFTDLAVGHTPRFVPLDPPTTEDIQRLCRTVRQRILRRLRQRGRYLDDQDADVDPLAADQPTLAACYAGAVQGRIALGPDAGAPITRLGRDPSARFEPTTRPLCANLDGFSLDAQIRIPQGQRPRLERLCRYAARPAIANERLSLTKDGKVRYELKKIWRDGSTHIELDPHTFLERLVALIPRPRVHLVSYHGILAPAASWRSEIVPEPPPASDELVVERGPHPRCRRTPRRRRHSWAELLRRVFAIDAWACPCGGRRSLLAIIRDPDSIRRFLAHLGLPTEPPPIATARPPPQTVLPFA